MPDTHLNHDHVHGINCRHTVIRHGNHVDYLHDGHLHHQGKDGVIEEHVLEVAATNPAVCTGGHICSDHFLITFMEIMLTTSLMATYITNIMAIVTTMAPSSSNSSFIHFIFTNK